VCCIIISYKIIIIIKIIIFDGEVIILFFSLFFSKFFFRLAAFTLTTRDGQIFWGGEGKGKGKRIFRAPALLFVSDSSVVRSSV
jgi:hypothetical protein